MINDKLNIGNLSFLVGTWKGNGAAQYPTIKTVEYSEELIFKQMEGFDVLQYEQKTWVESEKGNFNKSIFWDCGFIINKENNNLEFCSTQKSGRMEILSGKLIQPAEDFYEVSFNSKAIYNDKNLIKSGRKFIFSNSSLQYELWMSISKNQNYDIHLKASLKKQLY